LIDTEHEEEFDADGETVGDEVFGRCLILLEDKPRMSAIPNLLPLLVILLLILLLMGLWLMRLVPLGLGII